MKLHLVFSGLIYFDYSLSFFDSFDLDQFLFHLFFRPQVELVFNNCYFCLMILTDDTESSFEFFNSTEHYFRLVFSRSGTAFLPDLSDKFILQKNDRFRCTVFYKSESKYQIRKSGEERCMKFVVIANPTDLIISCFELFVRFFGNFFLKCQKIVHIFLKNKQEILIKDRFY